VTTTTERPTAPPARPVDSHSLERALAQAVDGEVRFDREARGLYSTDASHYRQVPIGVVVPRSREAVIDTVRICRDHGAPITSRGGGTSLAGQCCNVAVVVDFSKYLNRILEIDPEAKTAWVEPGCVLDDLRSAAAGHQLTFAPDPSTHSHNTLGGMIGNNSCGIHSVRGGRTADNVHELEIVTADGEVMTVGPVDDAGLSRLCGEEGRIGDLYRGLRDLRDRHAEVVRARDPDIPRRVSGYNLDERLPEKGFHVARALVGTEGTCVTVLRARLRLVDLPRHHTLVVVGFPDVAAAGDAVPEILNFGVNGLEGMDRKLVTFMKAKRLSPGSAGLLPDGDG